MIYMAKNKLILDFYKRYQYAKWYKIIKKICSEDPQEFKLSREEKNEITEYWRNCDVFGGVF